jgi:hypothetical protein
MADNPELRPDDLGMDIVAARLGKSVGWLRWRLSQDRGEIEPRLQFHHYIGRTLHPKTPVIRPEARLSYSDYAPWTVSSTRLPVAARTSG